jgi:hypothetical protein
MSDAAQAFGWLAVILDQQVTAASDAGAAAFRAQDMAAAAQAMARVGELQELQQQFSAFQQRWSSLVQDDDDVAPSQPAIDTAPHVRTDETADSSRRRWKTEEFEVDGTEVVPVSPMPAAVRPAGKQTPIRSYYRPILQALSEFGGQASVQAVVQRVKQLLEPQFTEIDYTPQPAHPREPRWINNTQWARKELVELGLMLPKRRTGIWEISEAGRRWLAEQE